MTTTAVQQQQLRRSKRLKQLSITTEKREKNDANSTPLVGSSDLKAIKSNPDLIISLSSNHQAPPELVESSSSDNNKISTDLQKTTLHVQPKEEEEEERPTPMECRQVVLELSQLHPHVIQRNDARRRRNNKNNNSTENDNNNDNDSILDSVVGIILSQNTTSANSRRAFAKLKQTFPHWDQVAKLSMPPVQLEEAIRCGGLAQTKSRRILLLVQTLVKQRGAPPSLEYLRKLSTKDVHTELSRFEGLGPKTISCVLLFALDRPDFAVDTHVFRITQQMGWISSSSSKKRRWNRQDAYMYLNAKIPNEYKLDLHCLLIAHGKSCHECAARNKPQFPPSDGSRLSCPLLKFKITESTTTTADATKKRKRSEKGKKQMIVKKEKNNDLPIVKMEKNDDDSSIVKTEKK